MSEEKKHSIKILLVGGGSGGSVSPLLAVGETLKNEILRSQFLFVGGNGVEKKMAEAAGFNFTSISAGKFRRYLSWQNFLSPFQNVAGYFQARKILKAFKPDVVFGAGSFVQVPVVWAAYFLKIPVVLHQQDVVPSLSNKLCQAAASKITVTFEKSLTDFESGNGLFYKKSSEKVVLTGNPFRRDILEGSKAEAEKFFGLKKDLPTLLVLGGGTGAEGINRVVLKSLPSLTKFMQVIHISGKGKSQAKLAENYFPYEFISEMNLAYAAADIVVSRCGLSTLTELCALKKVCILVPMPNSHQEVNALVLDSLRAAVVLRQNHFTERAMLKLTRDLLFSLEMQKILSNNIGKILPKNADQKIAKIIIKLAEKNNEF